MSRLGRPKGVEELAPRKKMVSRASKDGQAYLGSDSGCVVATKYLGGKQSLCLECPFDVCQLDTAHQGRRAKLVDK